MRGRAGGRSRPPRAVPAIAALVALCAAACGGGDAPEPPAPAPPSEPELAEGPVDVVHVVAEGENFGAIAAAHGIPYSEMLALVEAGGDLLDLTRIRAGRTLQLRFDAGSDALLALSYRVDDFTWIVIERGPDGGFTAREEAVPYEVAMVALTGAITAEHTSFWAACSAMGLQAEDIIALAEIFEYDVDFATEVRQGDRIAVWIEELSLEGSFERYGTVHAGRYINDGRGHEALRFTPTDDVPGYYTSEGMSTRKKFLRSPLKYSRIASGFNRSRFHPILHEKRPHWGTDFSAPSGTPVRALGSGRVTFAGWRGGYGNLVIIQHDERYSTRYGHLRGFGKGIRAGTNVEQGQIIGYVGTTGLSTGPHLHFEFRIDGNPVDFMKQEFPNTEPVSEADMPRFLEEKAALLEHLDAVLPPPPPPPAAPGGDAGGESSAE